VQKAHGKHSNMDNLLKYGMDLLKYEYILFWLAVLVILE
jgi:hypothetical protein